MLIPFLGAIKQSFRSLPYVTHSEYALEFIQTCLGQFIVLGFFVNVCWLVGLVWGVFLGCFFVVVLVGWLVVVVVVG